MYLVLVASLIELTPLSCVHLLHVILLVVLDENSIDVETGRSEGARPPPTQYFSPRCY